MTNADGSPMVNEIEESGGYGSTKYKGNRTGGKQSSGENGQGGVVSSGNSQDDNNGTPTYAGTLDIATPTDYSADSWDETLEESGAYKMLDNLQNDNPDKEVGFFIRKAGNEFYADFFIGIDKDTWMNVSNNPYGRKLNANEKIVGFVHTHPDGTNSFSSGDRSSIYYTSMGSYIWMNNSPISASSLNMNFFGLCYGTQYNSISSMRGALSWNYANNLNESKQFINEIFRTTQSSLHYNTWKVSDYITPSVSLKNSRNKK
jgi:proteasome lid subunit RPN8/RPN11